MMEERLKIRKPTEKLSKIVGDMFDQILAVNVMSSGGIGTDNMTAILIQFVH